MTSRCRFVVSSLIPVVCVAVCGQALAQIPENDQLAAPEKEYRPWAAGVAAEDKAKAGEYFKVGNRALDEGNFGDAKDAFQAALEHWNHPALQYNLALALIGQKGNPVLIYKALEQAMRYGPAPLDEARYERAREYRDIYNKQLARIALTCNEPDTKVTLDGKLVLTGPGRYADVVTVGEHIISATKSGYISINKTRIFKPEEAVGMDLVMYTLADRTRYERRYPVWVPWTLAISGATLLAAGGTLNYLSVQNREAYGDLVARICEDGCGPDDVDTSLRDRADWQETTSYVGYGVGGVAAAVGVVMLFLNQPKKIVDIEDDEEVAVTPLLSPDHVGVAAYVRF